MKFSYILAFFALIVTSAHALSCKRLVERCLHHCVQEPYQITLVYINAEDTKSKDMKGCLKLCDKVGLQCSGQSRREIILLELPEGTYIM